MGTPSYCQVKTQLASARSDIVQARKLKENAAAQVAQATATLTNMPTTYGDLVSEVNAQATANPSNPEWQALKAGLDLALAERQALLDELTA